jgi:hypothetical protein
MKLRLFLVRHAPTDEERPTDKDDNDTYDARAL